MTWQQPYPTIKQLNLIRNRLMLCKLKQSNKVVLYLKAFGKVHKFKIA